MARILNKHKQSNSPLKRKVFVAMSGGVDSSFAAALLKRQGFDVIGVFFKPWSPSKKLIHASPLIYCNWQQDRLDAMRVASLIGIPFLTWDFSKEYGTKVAKYMIEGYKNGITPNPDVMCNKEIKFGVFLKKALSHGADYIATGHYARICKTSSGHKNIYNLQRGIDKQKDQSYFLWTLTREQIEQCLFPIGGFTKKQVRSMAKLNNLPNYNKKDSQGVCFVGELDMKDFLQQFIKKRLGDIVDSDTGKKIGTHEGAAYYTIGQRHGLRIGNGLGPYFVSAKNMERNEIIVSRIGRRQAVDNIEIKISNLNWLGSNVPGRRLLMQTRYRQTAFDFEIQNSVDSKTLTVRVKKDKRVDYVAPGQSTVFYDKDVLVGGGIIVSTSEN